MRLLVRAVALLLLLTPLAGVAQEKKKYKILYISQSKGFKHGSVDRKKDAPLAPSEISMTEIGQSSGLFDVECTQDASLLTAETSVSAACGSRSPDTAAKTSRASRAATSPSSLAIRRAR